MDKQELPLELVEGFQQLASGDFSYRMPRSLTRDESDTIVFFFNTIAEEMERIIRESKANENRLNDAVNAISEALMQVAVGNLEVHIERDYKGDQIDVLSFLVDSTISELRLFVAKNEQRNAEIQARLETLVEERTAKLQEQARVLEQMAITDPLTQAYNRRHFYKFAEIEMKRAQRNKQPLSVIVMDADHFKRINDTYGHQVGDQVLVKLTAICQSMIRDTDIFARYGGEEFAALLPGTDMHTAKQIAERIRKKVEAAGIKVEEKKVRFTISLGVATLQNPQELTFDSLLTQADRALYVSKNTGRNRVTHWMEQTDPYR